MMYYLLNPEVSGELGDGCKIEYKNGMIHEITFLEYHFTGWMGDELLTAHPCFIVTKELEHDICAEGLTGVDFREISVTFSDEFYEMCGDIKVPQFVQIICCFPYEASITYLMIYILTNIKK